jgi:malate dehydrogenase (oxaloacetate-decarboxylating)(NADP+)
MEGKGILFQKFAGIDVFDIEIDERDPDKLVEIIASLEPTFGGINLEDIKAPECFIVERKLRERMNIPVFHDDQHGTAIIVGAAVYNALEIVGKKIGDVKLATSGAGARHRLPGHAGRARHEAREHPRRRSRRRALHRPRHMDPDKARYARDTDKRTLADIVEGADIFLGLSAGGVLKPEMVATMADKPIILALANPNPEILPEDAKKVRPGLHHRHRPFGLSEPGQQRVVLPLHLPRRAGRRRHRDRRSDEARLRARDRQARAHGIVRPRQRLRWRGAEVRPRLPDPRPFDPRLLVMLAPAVAKAAMDSGIAARPIATSSRTRKNSGSSSIAPAC